MEIYEEYDFPEGDCCIICKGRGKGRIVEITQRTGSVTIYKRYHWDCYVQRLLEPSQPMEGKK